MLFRTSLLVSAAILVAACGPSEQRPAATPSPSATPAPSASAVSSPSTATANVPPPPKPWDQLTRKERTDVMKTAVLPNMKSAFQSMDPKDFADFTCVTCHGERIKQGNFDMPNPNLPKLDFKNNLKDDIANHPAMVKFMENVVEPEMVTMLGVQPFDMKTMKGFGCNGCHIGK